MIEGIAGFPKLVLDFIKKLKIISKYLKLQLKKKKKLTKKNMKHFMLGDQHQRTLKHVIKY